MITRLYGIQTCDSCRKARRWLDNHGIDYHWIDLRQPGVDRPRLESWRAALGDAALLNKRSKTWRNFDARQRAAAETDPVPVLLAHPTLIKRPILETGAATRAGFSVERYRALLGITA